MRERGLGNLTKKVRSFCSPIAESRSEPMHSHVSTHSPQQHLHRHVAHHGPTIARKHKFVLAKLTHPFEHRHRRVGEWHTMLAATLHSIGRHGPHPGLEVYLVPPSADHFARPRSG